MKEPSWKLWPLVSSNCVLTMGDGECGPGLVLMGSKDLTRSQLVLICFTKITATQLQEADLKQKALGRTLAQPEI